MDKINKMKQKDAEAKDFQSLATINPNGPTGLVPQKVDQ
jgi:hypothetical protein